MSTSIARQDSKRLMVFAGRSSQQLGGRIASRLGIELGEVTLKTFANGEIYVRFEESVRGADVFLVQSTCRPVNDSLMELLVMIDAAKLASAHRITAVIPWYGYSRQDKKSAPREPITAKLVAELLQAAGVDRVLTMDLHAGQVQGFFRVPVDHMTALPMFVDYFKERVRSGGITEPLVVVSPDAGRAKLASHFAERLGAQLAVLTKQHRAQRGRDHPADRRRCRSGGHFDRRHDRHRRHPLRRCQGGQAGRSHPGARRRDPWTPVG